MKTDVNPFLNTLLDTEKPVNPQGFFVQGALYLQAQLCDYLCKEGVAIENSFLKQIKSAQRHGNSETDKAFWRALHVIHSLSTMPSHHQCERKWLRFINIIEKLQGYNGSQLFAHVGIKKKRLYRLYFAYMLSWEHLRYLAGNDDEFSPSAIVLDTFSSINDDHDHSH
ncbi:hypothetical protein [Psychromonas sp. MME2]|uniref:hypothetical protein n=1 Tax=unclassified Psychromonas TaxID=2614957 RepID=UPI00339BB601